MFRAMGVIFAGTMLAMTAGCTPDQFTLAAKSKGKTYVMAGSPDAVSFVAETTLRGMGAPQVVRPQSRSDTIRLQSQHPNGEKFTLTFRKPRGEQGEKTLIQIDWEKSGDDVFWGNLITRMLNPNQGQQTMPGMPGQPGMMGQPGMQPAMGSMPQPQGFPPSNVSMGGNPYGMQQMPGYPQNPQMGPGMGMQGNSPMAGPGGYPGGGAPNNYSQPGQYGQQQ